MSESNARETVENRARWASLCDAAIHLKQMTASLEPGDTIELSRSSVNSLVDLIDAVACCDRVGSDLDRQRGVSTDIPVERTPPTSRQGVHDNPIVRAIIADIEAAPSLIVIALHRAGFELRQTSD